MTAGEHSCTRRALLGAAVVGSVVGGGGASAKTGPHPPLAGQRAPPSPDMGEGLEEDWEVALAELARAEAELRVVERGISGLAFETAEAVQGFYDARSEAWEAALGRAFLVPAPDVGAFAAKVVWAVDLGVAEFGEGPAWLAALRADAVRLGGLA